MKVAPESNVPKVIREKHIGTKVVYRLPNQAVLCGGVIDGLSPEGKFVCINKTRWIENGKGQILAMLNSRKKRRKAL